MELVEKQNALLWEVTFWEFLFVTVVLGGAAAWMTGRSFARSWESEWRLAGAIVLLGAAVRFIHFALFSGTLVAPWYYIVDLVVLLVIAFLGMRVTRSRQMATRYSFKYERSGPLGWTEKAGS